MPDIGQCEILRNTYGYPPARLSRHPAPAPNTITWVGRHYQRLDPPPGWHGAGAGLTSRALDNYHSRLLNSHNPDDNVDGVMSSVYWGYYAGQNGRVNGYAETRAGWVLLGRPHGPVPSTVAQIHGAVAIAKLSMHTANYQAALTAIKGSITYIGRSFASKVIAFMDPVHCGVLDAVVQSKLANSAARTAPISGWLSFASISRRKASACTMICRTSIRSSAICLL